MNRTRCRRLLVAVVLAAFCAAAQAATFTVTSLADSGSGSLREAIVDANLLAGPDVIDLRGQSGVLELATPLPTIASDITILGPGAATLLITRGPFGPAGTITDNVFTLPAHSGAWLKVDGLRFAHTAHLEWKVAHVGEGTAAEFDNCEIERTGGFVNNAGLTFRDCVVVRNSGLNYGAVLQEGTEGVVITAEHTLFQHNAVHASSSAMHNEAGVLEERAGWAYFTDCRLLDNDGRQGAGAIRAAGHLRVRDCVFRNNVTLPTSRGGGAIRLEGPLLEWTIERSLFDANSSSFGGGLCVGYVGYFPSEHIPARVYDSCFKANHAAVDGGGVFAESGLTVLVSCTVSGNAAGGSCGGVGGRVGSCAMFSCTVTLNSAQVLGGSSVVTAANCVIAGNLANSWPDVQLLGIGGGYNFIGVIPPPTLNLVSTLDNPTDTAGTPAEPLSAMLGPLQDNGGPVPTHMPMPGSPLIDAGSIYSMTNSNAHNVYKIEFLRDSRGLPRLVDFSAIRNPMGGDGMDIGAVEVQAPWRLVDPWRVIRLTAVQAGVASTPVEVKLEAQALSGALTIRVTPPFEVSREPGSGFGSSVLSDAPGPGGVLAPMSLFVRYRSNVHARHDGVLRIEGVEAQEIPLSGQFVSGSGGGRLVLEDHFLGFQTFLSSPAWHTPHLVPRTVILSGVGVSGLVSVDVPPPYEVALTPTGEWGPQVQLQPAVGGTLAQTVIHVRMNTRLSGGHFGILQVTTGSAPTVELELYGFYSSSVAATVVPMSRNQWAGGDNGLNYKFFETSALGAASAEQSVMVWFTTGFTGPISVRATPPFEVSNLSGTGFQDVATRPYPATGHLATPIYIRYRPSFGESHRGRLMVSSPGKQPFELPLLGIVASQPRIFTSTQTLNFTVNPTLPASALSYQVWGSGLTAPVNVICPQGYTSAGGMPFRIALSPSGPWTGSHILCPDASGNLQPTTVYVTFQPTAAPTLGQTYTGHLHHSSKGSAVVTIQPLGSVSAGLRAGMGFMQFNCGVDGPSGPQVFSVRGINAGPATVTAPQAFEVALSAGGPWGTSVMTPAPVSGVLQPVPIHVRFKPTSAGTHLGVVEVAAPGVLNVIVHVTGTTSPGFVEASVDQLVFQQPGISTPSGVASYQVHGYGLSAPITATVAAPFEVALSAAGPFGASVVTAPPVDGHVAPTTVFVRYSPVSGTFHGAEIVHSSGTATADSVTLSAAINAPALFVNSLPLAFTTGIAGLPSMVQSYEVSGVFLSAPIQIIAPPAFEVSLSPGGGYGSSVVSPAPVDGVVAPITVYARYLPATGTQHAGAIVHDSTGAQQVDLPVTGSIVPPTVQASVAALLFAVPVVGMASPVQSYDVSAQNLVGPVVVSAPGDFEVSLSPGTGFSHSVLLAGTAGVLAPTPVYVRYRPSSGSQHAGLLDHATQGGAAVQVALSGEVTPPRIVVSIQSLDFVALTVGLASAAQTYDVSGFFLSGPVTVFAPPEFEVSLSAGTGFGAQIQTPLPAGGVLAPTTVYVRYNPAAIGPHSGMVSNSSPGVPVATVAVTGTIPPLPGQVQVSTGTLALVAPAMGMAAEGHYDVSGFNLSDAITVSASPPFEVSLTPGVGFGAQVQTGMPIGGAVAATRIYARYLPGMTGVVSGTITHDTVGVASVTVALTGDVAPPPAGGGGGGGGGGCTACAASAPLWLMVALAVRQRRRTRH